MRTLMMHVSGPVSRQVETRDAVVMQRLGRPLPFRLDPNFMVTHSFRVSLVNEDLSHIGRNCSTRDHLIEPPP